VLVRHAALEIGQGYACASWRAVRRGSQILRGPRDGYTNSFATWSGSKAGAGIRGRARPHRLPFLNDGVGLVAVVINPTAPVRSRSDGEFLRRTDLIAATDWNLCSGRNPADEQSIRSTPSGPLVSRAGRIVPNPAASIQSCGDAQKERALSGQTRRTAVTTSQTSRVRFSNERHSYPFADSRAAREIMEQISVRGVDFDNAESRLAGAARRRAKALTISRIPLSSNAAGCDIRPRTEWRWERRASSHLWIPESFPSLPGRIVLPFVLHARVEFRGSRLVHDETSDACERLDCSSFQIPNRSD